MGITTAIEKNSSNNAEGENSANTVLQFITNGMIEKKNMIYILIQVMKEIMNYQIIKQNKKNLIIN